MKLSRMRVGVGDQTYSHLRVALTTHKPLNLKNKIGILEGIRGEKGDSMSGTDFMPRMACLASMFWCELTVQIGEDKKKRNGRTDVCSRTNDLTFAVGTACASNSVMGNCSMQCRCAVQCGAV